MRGLKRGVRWVFVLAFGAVLQESAGCYDLSSSCELYACASGAGGSPGSSSSATSGSSSSTSSSGSGGQTGAGGVGPMPVSCVPRLNTGPVASSCGVFVSRSRGNDASSGSPGEPVATFERALALAGGKRAIYACAETFSERLVLPSGVALYGGLDCTHAWLYAGDSLKTVLTAPPDTIPLVLESGSTATRIEDLHVLAAPSQAPSGSSIAVVADGATAELSGCLLESGAASDGAAGAAFPGPQPPAPAGDDGTEACSSAVVLGGAEVDNVCGSAFSSGGGGGIGELTSGFAGNPGTPAGAKNGGAGDTGSGCADGTKGDDGLAGSPGPGALGLGTIARSGFTGPPPLAGQPGLPGEGGGGGGASRGGNTCPAMSAGGASGGSGGPGGCGGLGGRGGQSGGASIALVSLKARLVFSDVRLQTARGGDGGYGGKGQTGSAPGLGGHGGSVPVGSSLSPGCDGGPGGFGGDGGQGGGGAGGPSIGLAYLGAPPALAGLSFQLGTRGLGGAGAGALGQGADGVRVETQAF